MIVIVIVFIFQGSSNRCFCDYHQTNGSVTMFLAPGSQNSNNVTITYKKKHGDRGNRTLTIVRSTDFLFTTIFIAVIKTCKMDSIFTLVLLFKYINFYHFYYLINKPQKKVFKFLMYNLVPFS